MSFVSASTWKTFLNSVPNAHLLQSAEWGELKANFGWEVHRIILENSGAQILVRKIFPGIKIAYIPKGPVGINWNYDASNIDLWDTLISEIDNFCQEQRVFTLKIEPDCWVKKDNIAGENEDSSHNKTTKPPNGFLKGTHSIQPQRTIVIDLNQEEDLILGRMKQKTRYNIKLARRKGIVIHPSADISLFYRLMEETSKRDKFMVHDRNYYQQAYDIFHPRGYCELFLAGYQNETVAGMMVFAYGDRSWYLYGASSNLHRERMPNYLIQWEAIHWAKAHGCREYDLWGVPDEDLETLETQFTQRSDGLWGVYRFKRGFGGVLKRHAGPWDRVYNPLLYNLYRWWLRSRAELGD